MSELLAGRHAALEALRANKRRFFRLWLEGNEGTPAQGIVAEILTLAEAQNIPIRYIQRGLFDKLREERVNHQGVALETGGFPYTSLDDILSLRHPDPIFLLLDHVQDPQNLGTLIRTAEAMGVVGVVIPDRRAAGITPAVSNASAGAVEHLPVAQVTNLNRVIDDMKKAHIWVAGLDGGEDAMPLSQANLAGPMAFVVGNEGSGLSRLTREKCDFLIRLPMVGQVASLNAAVAGSIVLYAARQARGA
jgi:23S rRNA (guanosine2251-2'-O)-methyltransferase